MGVRLTNCLCSIDGCIGLGCPAGLNALEDAVRREERQAGD